MNSNYSSAKISSVRKKKKKSKNLSTNDESGVGEMTERCADAKEKNGEGKICRKSPRLGISSTEEGRQENTTLARHAAEKSMYVGGDGPSTTAGRPSPLGYERRIPGEGGIGGEELT